MMLNHVPRKSYLEFGFTKFSDNIVWNHVTIDWISVSAEKYSTG